MRRILFLLLALPLATSVFRAAAEEVEIHIRVINGKSGRPVQDEKLNVYRDRDQMGSEVYPTGERGLILLRVERGASIRVAPNIYVTCHPYKAGDKERFYAVEHILAEGIVDSNMCGKKKVIAKPGEFVFFERSRSLWEWMRL